MYIMPPEPIITAYFTNSSNQSVCLCVYPSTVVKQRLGENVAAAINSHAITDEVLDASSSMRSVL
jgi:hypothetical protein